MLMVKTIGFLAIINRHDDIWPLKKQNDYCILDNALVDVPGKMKIHMREWRNWQTR